MFLSNIIFVVVSLSNQHFRAPVDWFESTTKLFDICLSLDFQHPICPPIHGEIMKATSVQAPQGDLSSEKLFDATALYQIGAPVQDWLHSLKLDKPKPSYVSARLWAEAQYLYGRVLFDKRQYKDAGTFFDKVVNEFKGRAVFHQQRAWIQFFTGAFDRSLGSIVSAESPLIYPVPYFEKYFLRALIERETCRWREAFATIAKSRSQFKAARVNVDKHSWVVLCERRHLGNVCQELRAYYSKYYQAQIKKALDDLDLLEIELRDKTAYQQAEKASAEIKWPWVGENWADELGYYSVPIESKC